ncbi:MAG: RNA-binding protein [candidate division Zixibacteria bacterium]|jgi:RNA recognition motif-containing protein|nr:RNA-binding protein [candidate division Zixibacteria bacterium]
MKLYVGNLASETTERDLSLLFSAHGDVRHVEIVRDQRTGESRRFAYVEMGSPAESTAAMTALDGARLHDRPLKILRGFIPPEPPPVN